MKLVIPNIAVRDTPPELPVTLASGYNNVVSSLIMQANQMVFSKKHTIRNFIRPALIDEIGRRNNYALGYVYGVFTTEEEREQELDERSKREELSDDGSEISIAQIGGSTIDSENSSSNVNLTLSEEDFLKTREDYSQVSSMIESVNIDTSIEVSDDSDNYDSNNDDSYISNSDSELSITSDSVSENSFRINYQHGGGNLQSIYEEMNLFSPEKFEGLPDNIEFEVIDDINFEGDVASNIDEYYKIMDNVNDYIIELINDLPENEYKRDLRQDADIGLVGDLLSVDNINFQNFLKMCLRLKI